MSVKDKTRGLLKIYTSVMIRSWQFGAYVAASRVQKSALLAKSSATLLVVLVFEELAVSTREPVARLAEQLQRLLLVNVAEDGLLRGHA